MIHIFYSIPQKYQHQKLFHQHLNTFPAAFQEKLQKFRRWQDAQASLLGRILLKKGLLTHFGKTLDYCSIAYTDLGKPYLKDSPIQFNISHTQGIVVCAIATDVVFGIDIEYRKTIDIREFKFQMTVGEWQLISTAKNQVDAFYNYWTRKEAIIKAEGKGFSMDLKSFEVLSCAHPILVAEKYWHLYPIEIDLAYQCHLAVNKMLLLPVVPQKIDF